VVERTIELRRSEAYLAEAQRLRRHPRRGSPTRD
jgi:hypothetical protein